LETLIRRCAGLDVHKASVVACVRVIDDNGELVSVTQSFGTTTSDLLKLNDWLMSYAVTLVGMESTGVYWKPVYTLLESEFECWLLNAQHLRNVPGRKTDVADAAWIAQLVAHGLVRPSFVPPKEIRELRELTRYRKAVIQDRSREAQRLHKTLESAGIKLANVATDILGVSGRDMLQGLIAGTHGRQAILGQNAQGLQVAAHSPSGSSASRVTNQGHLSGVSVRADQRPPRAQQSHHRRRAFHPRDRLPHFATSAAI
jgi:transposase